MNFMIFDEFVKSEVSLRNRDLESFLMSKFNKKHQIGKLRVPGIQFRRNWRLRMRLSRDIAISNRTALRSDASGVAFSEIRQKHRFARFWRIPENGKPMKSLEIHSKSLKLHRILQPSVADRLYGVLLVIGLYSRKNVSSGFSMISSASYVHVVFFLHAYPWFSDLRRSLFLCFW